MLLHIQLTLKQCGFELHGSTLYMDFFQPNMDWKYSILGMQKPVYGSEEPTESLEYAHILVYMGWRSCKQPYAYTEG